MVKQCENYQARNYCWTTPTSENLKGIAKELNTHSGDTLSYGYCQQLLKPADQNHDQLTQANPYRSSRKVHEHELDLISDLNEASNSSKEICDIDSTIPVLIANTISKRGDGNKLNDKGDEYSYFDEYRMIPKENFTALTPETKQFWDSIPIREKSYIFSSVRCKPKSQPPFTIKAKKYEIIVTLKHQCLTLEEDDVVEADTKLKITQRKILPSQLTLQQLRMITQLKPTTSYPPFIKKVT